MENMHAFDEYKQESLDGFKGFFCHLQCQKNPKILAHQLGNGIS